MFEIVRWVSIVLMWAALMINLWSFFRCERVRKQLKVHCDRMLILIKEWEENHNALNIEEDTDERNG